MKVVELREGGEVVLADREEPRAVENLVVVKNLIAPMCTEYKMRAKGRAAKHLGHEAAGEVVEVAQPGRVKPGDRVVVMPQFPCGKCALCVAGDYIHCENVLDMRGMTGSDVGVATYAQFVLKPDWLLLPVPEGMSIEHASMACCGLGPTFGAMQRMHVDAFDTVLIAGMGPVGLGGVINGVYRGARVIALEPHPWRANLARELGAVDVIDPTQDGAVERVRELTGGLGADKAIDCTGVAPAQRILIDATRRRGDVAFVGEGGEVGVHVSNDMIRKGLTLHGAWHWNLADAPRMMRMIAESGEQLDRQITHRFPMTRTGEAFDLQATGECGKVLLDPWR